MSDQIINLFVVVRLAVYDANDICDYTKLLGAFYDYDKALKCAEENRVCREPEDFSDITNIFEIYAKGSVDSESFEEKISIFNVVFDQPKNNDALEVYVVLKIDDANDLACSYYEHEDDFLGAFYNYNEALECVNKHSTYNDRYSHENEKLKNKYVDHAGEEITAFGMYNKKISIFKIIPE
jgi:hypothetical protein